MYYSNDAIVLKFVSKYTLLYKICNLYKQTRPYYVLLEFLFLIVNISGIIWFCILFISGVHN